MSGNGENGDTGGDHHYSGGDDRGDCDGYDNNGEEKDPMQDANEGTGECGAGGLSMQGGLGAWVLREGELSPSHLREHGFGDNAGNAICSPVNDKFDAANVVLPPKKCFDWRTHNSRSAMFVRVLSKAMPDKDPVCLSRLLYDDSVQQGLIRMIRLFEKLPRTDTIDWLMLMGAGGNGPLCDLLPQPADFIDAEGNEGSFLTEQTDPLWSDMENACRRVYDALLNTVPEVEPSMVEGGDKERAGSDGHYESARSSVGGTTAAVPIPMRGTVRHSPYYSIAKRLAMRWASSSVNVPCVDMNIPPTVPESVERPTQARWAVDYNTKYNPNGNCAVVLLHVWSDGAENSGYNQDRGLLEYCMGRFVSAPEHDGDISLIFPIYIAHKSFDLRVLREKLVEELRVLSTVGALVYHAGLERVIRVRILMESHIDDTPARCAELGTVDCRNATNNLILKTYARRTDPPPRCVPACLRGTFPIPCWDPDAAVEGEEKINDGDGGGGGGGGGGGDGGGGGGGGGGGADGGAAVIRDAPARLALISPESPRTFETMRANQEHYVEALKGGMSKRDFFKLTSSRGEHYIPGGNPMLKLPPCIDIGIFKTPAMHSLYHG
jgi:hypothetical protein